MLPHSCLLGYILRRHIDINNTYITKFSYVIYITKFSDQVYILRNVCLITCLLFCIHIKFFKYYMSDWWKFFKLKPNLKLTNQLLLTYNQCCCELCQLVFVQGDLYFCIFLGLGKRFFLTGYGIILSFMITNFCSVFFFFWKKWQSLWVYCNI